MYPTSGWLALLVGLAALGAGLWLVVEHVAADRPAGTDLDPLTAQTVVAAVLGLLGWFVLRGLFVLEPNQAAVLVFFGNYRGTVRSNGLRWVAPFYRRIKLSLRLNNLQGEVLKVNDRAGNPIEISTVVVWRVGDTAKATFVVDNFRAFVAAQSESAVRELAQTFAYDAMGGDQLDLREGGEAISAALADELQRRVEASGVVIHEARVNHLAYAPEIAQAMLRRQQAGAVVGARATIVDGAVTIAGGVLERLRDDYQVTMSDEDRGRLLSNLLVVLCSDSEVVPTISLASSERR